MSWEQDPELTGVDLITLQNKNTRLTEFIDRLVKQTESCRAHRCSKMRELCDVTTLEELGVLS